MQRRSLIIGGTKGLGLCLAQESLSRGIRPTILGRTATELRSSLVLDDPLREAIFIDNDISRGYLDERILFAVTPPPSDRKSLPIVFWNSGIFLRAPLLKTEDASIAELTAVHLTGPVSFLRQLHGAFCKAGIPYHLVTIASTAAWRARPDETVYSMLKAGKAHFTRCFAKEMTRDLPGSKATLVCPGGMANPNFWDGTGQDISKFVDSADIARTVWSRALVQTAPFHEYSIMRTDKGPLIKDGPQLPE